MVQGKQRRAALAVDLPKERERERERELERGKEGSAGCGRSSHRETVGIVLPVVAVNVRLFLSSRSDCC